eukprot:scaffold27710_cov140-Isochrysis_galbana.AAC.3
MSLDWPLGCPPEAHRSRAGPENTFPVERPSSQLRLPPITCASKRGSTTKHEAPPARRNQRLHIVPLGDGDGDGEMVGAGTCRT